MYLRIALFLGCAFAGYACADNLQEATSKDAPPSDAGVTADGAPRMNDMVSPHDAGSADDDDDASDAGDPNTIVDSGSPCDQCPTHSCANFAATGCDYLAFVTDEAVTGDFSGTPSVEPLDALCTSEATKAGVAGQFVAWAWSNDGTSELPGDRLAGDHAYYRRDGQLVASSIAGLIGGGALVNALDVTLKGDTLGASEGAWTGLGRDGGAPGGEGDCSQWTEGSGFIGAYGSPASSSSWLWAGTKGCGSAFHLYCFQKTKP